MENFIKAPWRYERQSGEIYGGKSDVLICDMLPTGDRVHDANAALIAAAPEMYEMLKEVNSYMGSPIIDALLAKARGEQ